MTIIIYDMWKSKKEYGKNRFIIISGHWITDLKISSCQEELRGAM